MRPRQRQQQLQGRLALPGLEAGQGAHRDAGRLGELGQRRAALDPGRPQPRADRLQDVLEVAHGHSLPFRQRSLSIRRRVPHPRSMEKTQSYDVVVVGGGAAGLSGALALGRARRPVLVVDAGDPRNAPAGHVHNYLGREGTPPAELLAIGRAEVATYGVEVRRGARDHGRPRRCRVRARARRRHRGPRPPAAGHHRADRRAAGHPGPGRAVRPRRPALPVLPRLGGARPGHRHRREQRRSPCTARCSGASGATTSRSSSTTGRRPRRTSSRSWPPAASPSSRTRWPRSSSRTTGWSAYACSSGEVVSRQALVAAPQFVANSDLLTSLGLMPVAREMDGEVVGYAVPADPNGATDGARRLGRRQRHRPACAGHLGRRRRSERRGHDQHGPHRGRDRRGGREVREV